MSTLAIFSGTNQNFNNIGANGAAPQIVQPFQVTTAGTVTSMQLWGSAGASASGTLKVEIRSGSWNGTVLITTGTLTTTSALSAYTGSPTWNVLNFTSSTALSLSTTYYLALTCMSGSTSDEVRLARDSSGSYAYGPAYFNGTQLSPYNFSFEVDGTVYVGTKGNFLAFM